MNKEFHLYNESISYVMKVMENGQMGQLYYGKKIHHRQDFSYLFELSVGDMAPCTYEGRSDFSLEHIKQEYPTFGTGDMRYPAYEILKKMEVKCGFFSTNHIKYMPGKNRLKGLPSTYVENTEEAETLEILLKDKKISCLWCYRIQSIIRCQLLQRMLDF